MKTVKQIVLLEKKPRTSKRVRKYVYDNKHFCFCSHRNMLVDGVSDLITIPSGFTLKGVIISQL